MNGSSLLLDKDNLLKISDILSLLLLILREATRRIIALEFRIIQILLSVANIASKLQMIFLLSTGVD